MGTVIPWTDIHPTVRSEAPFVAVVIVDPDRHLCVSEMITMEDDQLRSPDGAAQEVIAAAQLAAAQVARAYRSQRRQNGPLRVLPGVAGSEP